MPCIVHENDTGAPFSASTMSPGSHATRQEEALRAVQIIMLFVAAMLWLGVQAAQTEPVPAAPDDIPSQPVDVVEAG